MKIGSELKDGQRRLEVAKRYAAQFESSGPAADDLTLKDFQSPSDDAKLGLCASFVATKLERFEGRQKTVLAAQALSVAGSTFQFIPVAGQALGTALSVASTGLSMSVKLEQSYKNIKKRLDGNLGFARETVAVTLWGLGRKAHPASRAFLTELGIIDGPDGVLASNGFFDRPNLRMASLFIGEQLKSVARG